MFCSSLRAPHLRKSPRPCPISGVCVKYVCMLSSSEVCCGADIELWPCTPLTTLNTTATMMLPLGSLPEPVVPN